MADQDCESARVRDEWQQIGHTLTQALPYIQRYEGKPIVIKYGGHAMGDADLARNFARDIVLLKQVGLHPIIVHGGGPQIGKMLERLKIKSEFIEGLRVTDLATVEIVEMVLAGSINKQIVSSLNCEGGRAVGISGKDGNLMIASKVLRTSRDPESHIERHLDLGFVGEPEEVNPEILHSLMRSDLIPVVAPIGRGREGETFNVNADTAAGAVADAVGAERLLLLTDVAGVLGRDKQLIPRLDIAKTKALIADGTISGGMIPKLETATAAVEGGVKGAVIMDGRVPHTLLVELFTPHGAGTLVVREDTGEDVRHVPASRVKSGSGAKTVKP